MKLLRWLHLFLKFIASWITLSNRLKKRKEERMTKKQKEKLEQPASPSPSQAPVLTLKTRKQFLKGRPTPPFPPQKKMSQKNGSSSPGGSSLNEEPAAELVEGIPTALDIQAAGAIPDLISRGVHLANKDIAPLTEEEIGWLAEPLAKVFINLDWMEKIRLGGPYVELGVKISIIVISRARVLEKLKAERKKEAMGQEAPKQPDEKVGKAGAMEPGKS
jgi:hypothetical protein